MYGNYFKEMLGEEPPKHLERLYIDEINHALSISVTAVSGIEKALTEMSIPFCIASSDSQKKMQTTLSEKIVQVI